MIRSVLSCILMLGLALQWQLPAQQPTQKDQRCENVLVQVEKLSAVPSQYSLGFASITSKDSQNLLSFLASDLMEGRETGARGFKLAADYAASLFGLWGLEPAGDDGDGSGRSYLQEVVMKEYSNLGCTITWQATHGEIGKSHIFQEGVDLQNYYLNRVPETISAPVVFLGYGIDEKSIAYNDLAKIDIKDKVVMILDGLPGQGDPTSPFMKPELQQKYKALNSPLGRFYKAAEIAKLGPSAILVVSPSINMRNIYEEMGTAGENDERPIISEPNRLVTLPGAKREGGAIYITRPMANIILSQSGQRIEDLQAKIAAHWQPASFEIANAKLTIQTTATEEKLVRCHNVIGFIPGSDPKLKNETVMIAAHLDHLGKRDKYIFNGADDNGSGATGVLEIARAVSLMPQKPKRSIVFCLWTAEELKLLGSSYYCKYPAFPLAQTVAYLNLDMIGRPYDEKSIAACVKKLNIPLAEQKKIIADNFAVTSFACGLGFGEILQNANQAVGIDLWQQAEATVKRNGLVSDYLSFANHHVPYIYWAGVVHDDYHQTSDSVDKINLEWMTKIIRMAYLSTVMLADR